LYDIPQGEIEAVARDLRWESAGCKVYLAVDAKDVIDYCFPLNPFDISEQDLDRTAAEQTALDFVFRRRMPRPLLLPHYVDELTKYFDVIQNSSSQAYEDLEMWNRIRWGLSIGNRKTAVGREANDKFSSLKNNIVRYLAVWLGIDSFGSERFRKILQFDLKSVKDMCHENNDPDLNRIIDDYKPSRVKEIADFLEDTIPPSTPEYKRLTRAAASRRDARAVDWLLYLNAECSTLNVKNVEGNNTDGIPRYLFLYMSDAPKTAQLFDFLRHRNALLNYHRNRKQILLVARAGWGGDERTRISANLDEIALISRMIAEVEKGLQEACDRCTLQGQRGVVDCAWRDVCEAIKKVELKTADVPNLGLMSKLKQFKDILKARPRLTTDQAQCLEELKEILNTEIPDTALTRVLHQQSFAATQSLLARRLSESNSPNPNVALPEPFVSLSTIFSRLPGPYDRTQDLIASYCSLDWAQTDERRSVLLQAMHEFLELDEKQTYQLNKEHELARLLLHLAFGGDSGYFDVIERSRQLRESEAIRSDPYPFLVCSLIASLQLRRYVDGQRYATDAMKHRPHEPFLYHARGVNTFSWRIHLEQRAFCSRDIITCVEDETKALAFLRDPAHQGEAERSNHLEGLILNNLTFMQSYSADDEFAHIFDLEKAQMRFQELLKVVPRERWQVTPKYFHTEAHLEYQLACVNPDERTKHLNKARLAIESALRFRPNDKNYLKLQKQVEYAINCPSLEPLPALVFS
jgi:hypothetical protein